MSKQKYTIADVQQEKLIEYGLDIKDAFILTYLKEMSQLKNIVRKTVDNKSFIWIDYEKLMSYLPVLKINTIDAMYRRFKKYEDVGIVIKHLHKAMNGSYTFFCLEEKFFDLFEITKVSYSKDGMKEQLDKMGLSSNSDEKSGGFGSEVGSISDEKSALNTPIKIIPKKIAVAENKKSAAASCENFEKDLKELLNQEKITYNKNTVTNISKNSEKNLETVKEAVSYMKKSTKEMTPGVLVAILRDKDYTNTNKAIKGPQNRNEKVEFMKKYLNESEIQKLKELINKNLGTMPGADLYLDQELGNVLCQRYNKLPENERFKDLGH